ncbi:unnamed protein product [Symbiodinium pilosum]|uniref:EF-hand domain-containing protein n=1 Tax=Symbiodinium pilosum TaxID=2952 RepID=A0A812T753_SYMPI|nr:unnamed protein product [Symbiodinium pilosum]
MRSDFEAAAGLLICKSTGKMFQAGTLRTPTLADLKTQLDTARQEGDGEYYYAGALSFRNLTSDSLSLYQDPANAGAVFQVCSLFNCLETVDGYHPEDGITHYCTKATQGATSSIACPAATFFRNYFVHSTGQGASGRPVDLLEELAQLVENNKNGYWTMKNGHCLPRVEGSIAKLSHRLATNHDLENQARDVVQVGVHWETEVWQMSHQVCQVLCGALPVGYLKAVRSNDWYVFAKAKTKPWLEVVILRAERWFFKQPTRFRCVMAEAAKRGTRVKAPESSLHLAWCHEVDAGLPDGGALERALENFASEPLDVILVHFSSPLPDFEDLEADPRRRSGHDEDRDLLTQKPFGARYPRAFSLHDQNGDGEGVLDRAEFFTMLHKLDEEFFTPHVVDVLLKEADVDQDGKIYYHEFVRWICQEDEDIVNRVLH